MSFIKIFNKDKQSKNSLYESVLAKYEKKHSDIFVDTCNLMNAIENNSEFLNSISRDFTSMSCYLERTLPSRFGHTYNYRIVHGCDYSNSFNCQITTDNDFKLTFVVDLYFPTTIRISAVKTSDTYFDNKKVILDIFDRSLNLINEILTEELDRIKNIIMQLNLVYREYPSVINDNPTNIKKAFLHNITQLQNYQKFYHVPPKHILKYNSFYLIDDSGRPKEFFEELANGGVRRFSIYDLPNAKFVSTESFDNYTLAINLLADKYNTTFCLHANFGKIDIPDA